MSWPLSSERAAAMSLSLLLSVSLPIALISLLFWGKSLRRSVRHIRGPSGAEWLVGHEFWLSHQMEVNKHETALFAEYGNVFRTKGSFNQDVLLIADPKALHYILQKSKYTFVRPNDDRMFFESLYGEHGSLVNSTGHDHARQRKILLPAFSAIQLRAYLDVFHEVSRKLGEKWLDLASEGAVINVADWLARASLEMVGETAFDYKFNCVEAGFSKSELAVALKGMLVDAQLFPSRKSLLFNGFIRLVPTSICGLINRIPSRQNDRLRQFYTSAEKVVNVILADKRSRPVDPVEKDVLSVLLRANMEEDPSKRLTDGQLVAQLATVIFAGNDTTATTLTWTFWELAKNHEIQERLRAEIQQMRQRVGDRDFTATEYDSMTLLNAVIKETLRIHAVSSMRTREASTDDVIPLSEPLMTAKGLVTEIPVPKGQAIHVYLSAYNRLTSVWGEDADQWNPDRWLNPERAAKGDVNVGMTSNLMTFGAGPQGCIGWKFAITEAQVIAAQLIERFDFNVPESKPRILRLSSINLIPMVDGHMEEGVQMPLHITPLNNRV